MTERTARRLALGLWLFTIALALVALAFVALSFRADLPDNWGFRGYGALSGAAFVTAGALIARSPRRNAVGWLLCGAGVVSALTSAGQEYASYAVFIRPGSLPGAEIVAWVDSWIWLLFTGPLLFAVLLFPDGRLPSARWRAYAWLSAATVGIGVFTYGLRPGALENFSGLANPFAASGTLETVRSAVQYFAPVLFVGVFASGAFAPLARIRRSGPVERQQFKWLAFAGVVSAIALTLVIVSPWFAGRDPLGPPDPAGASPFEKASQAFVIFAFLAIPTSVGFAILRYRLYDIDVVINRALVYGTTTAGIAVAFFGGIVLLQALLRPITGGSELAVAASTLASLALFQPLRRRVQDTIDRRFYRSRYDAARTLDAFSVRLRDEVDLDAVRGELVAAVRDTVQPAHASVWLR
ncbi:MAG TPA: hypothetical protein VGK15_03570 [Candidatus Limnocylindria bacterium]